MTKRCRNSDENKIICYTVWCFLLCLFTSLVYLLFVYCTACLNKAICGRGRHHRPVSNQLPPTSLECIPVDHTPKPCPLNMSRLSRLSLWLATRLPWGMATQSIPIPILEWESIMGFLEWDLFLSIQIWLPKLVIRIVAHLRGAWFFTPVSSRKKLEEAFTVCMQLSRQIPWPP